MAKRAERKNINARTFYGVEGTAVRAPEIIEFPIGREPERKRKPKPVSEQVRKNRARIGGMDLFYVAFLAAACVAAIVICINYLHLKEMKTTAEVKNASLQYELTTIKSENDALYEDIVNSVDWDALRQTAEAVYGMHAAGEDQTVYYDAGEEGYVRQYREVPSGSGGG